VTKIADSRFATGGFVVATLIGKRASAAKMIVNYGKY
jgi:hypothetical protein